MAIDPDKTARKDGETRRSPAAWSREDLAFAVGELGREFASAPAGRTAAVEQAAARLPAEEGRVRLLQLARRLLRTG